MASETKGNKVDISTFLSCFNVNFMSCVSREMHPEIIFYWFVATLVNVFYYFEKYEIFQLSWRTKFCRWRRKIAASGKRKVKWKSTLNVQIKMASTKRDNCTRKRNYADARKFRKKNHNLTVVYVQRLCYQDTKTCFKMHSITAKDGKTWYLVQRTSFTIPLASECWGERIIARVMKSSWQSLYLL